VFVVSVLGSITSWVATAEACSPAIAAARLAIDTKKERFFITGFPIFFGVLVSFLDAFP